MEMTPERIRYLRKRLGLSQDKLGQLLNVHQSLISHWEKGIREPDAYQIEQLTHLYESARDLDEQQHQKFEEMMAAGMVAAAAAFLIGLGIGYLTQESARKKGLSK